MNLFNLYSNSRYKNKNINQFFYYQRSYSKNTFEKYYNNCILEFFSFINEYNIILFFQCVTHDKQTTQLSRNTLVDIIIVKQHTGSFESCFNLFFNRFILEKYLKKNIYIYIRLRCRFPIAI